MKLPNRNTFSPITWFVMKTLLWLPMAFAIWYLLAAPLMLPLLPILDLLLGPTTGFLEDIRLAHGHFVFDTTLAVETPDGRSGLATLEVNALKYTYNLPLLVALLYAGSDRYFSFWRLGAIYLLLIPFHVWGVSFDLLSQVTFHLGPEVADQAGISGWGREAVALGYQFGYLMLPPISTAAIWILLNKEMVKELSQQNQQ